ncbi:hypothetical protein [Novosphingobium sp. CF614]|uniref:hypothetical protein n=1 Tax=Novosphingobium sp. CF614 TaxID=1884364 RepID=UPI001160706F|nr:hypothetical protein [Novosphingobium sp. CF614]
MFAASATASALQAEASGDVGRKIVQPLIAALPAPLAQAVRTGSNKQDLAPYLNAALARGGAFDLGGFTYRIAGRLSPAPETRITGKGMFLADPAFDDRGKPDGLQMMIRIVDGLHLGKGVVFDGNSIGRAGFWLTGARNTGSVSGAVLNATFRNLSFDGIDVSRNAGAWRNHKINIGAKIENVGWIGANIEGVEGLVHDGLQVSRTGFHGIYVGHVHNVRGDGFSVDKSRPPYRVYDGPGSFGGREKGFLFGHFSTSHARWTRFHLFDNRHAEYDGFGIGEDGLLADEESTDIFAQGEIWYAGLFGFDVSSDMSADIKVHYPARQGVQFGLDLGGTLSNIKVKAVVEGNRADESARFSATGAALRKVSMQAGSPVVTIMSAGDFTVVPGQFAIGGNLAPGTKVVSVSGERVTLDRPASKTYSAGKEANVTFRASITFRNCLLDLQASKTRYGVGVESDADGFTHYTNVRIVGDLSEASGSSIRRLNGPLPAGMIISAKLNSAGQATEGGSP